MIGEMLYIGNVDDNGILKLNRKKFDEEIKQFTGKRVEIIVRRLKKKRSLEQNRALWGLAYPMAVKGFEDMGHQGVTKEDVHAFFKEKFKPAFKEMADPETGELLKIPSTAKGTTTEIMGYFSQIQQWCAEWLGINIPDPDPLFNLEN